MAKKLEWSGTPLNPFAGCSRVGPVCKNCYAELFAWRLIEMGQAPSHYTGVIQKKKSISWTGVVNFNPDVLKKISGKSKVYFANSMSDMWHENVDTAWIDECHTVFAKHPEHLFLVLTKRGERLGELGNTVSWPDNVWMGVSVGDKASLRYLDGLRRCPAKLKFMSIEPLIEDLGDFELKGIDWVIVAGESGSGARKMEDDWVRRIRDLCVESNVPLFFKQWGDKHSSWGHNDDGKRRKIKREPIIDGRYWLDYPTNHQAIIKKRLMFTDEYGRKPEFIPYPAVLMGGTSFSSGLKRSSPPRGRSMEFINDPGTRAAIEARFNTLVSLAGRVRGLIASGPPGVGKSFGIEQELIRKCRKVQIIRAGLSPIGLYVKLWETRTADYTLVIDDSDNILSMREGIDLLKAAFDTNDPRRVQWNKANKSLEQMGVPQQFEYDGQIIFITNMDMKNARPRSRQPDYDALMSRASYLDLELNSIEDKLIRCQMALEEGMLSDFPISVRGKVLEYVHKYAEYFNELSLRTLVKLGEAITQFHDWEPIAASTLMSNPPAAAYTRFAATGAGEDALNKISSKTLEGVTTVTVELFGDEHHFFKSDVDQAAVEQEETYRRIETIDKFFLKTAFSKRMKPDVAVKSGAGMKKYLSDQGFKVDGLTNEQGQELYDFILSNVMKFEQIDEPTLKQMVSVYRLPSADWKKAILQLMTKRAIAKNV